MSYLFLWGLWVLPRWCEAYFWANCTAHCRWTLSGSLKILAVTRILNVTNHGLHTCGCSVRCGCLLLPVASQTTWCSWSAIILVAVTSVIWMRWIRHQERQPITSHKWRNSYLWQGCVSVFLCLKGVMFAVVSQLLRNTLARMSLGHPNLSDMGCMGTFLGASGSGSIDGHITLIGYGGFNRLLWKFVRNFEDNNAPWILLSFKSLGCNKTHVLAGLRLVAGVGCFCWLGNKHRERDFWQIFHRLQLYDQIIGHLFQLGDGTPDETLDTCRGSLGLTAAICTGDFGHFPFTIATTQVQRRLIP